MAVFKVDRDVFADCWMLPLTNNSRGISIRTSSRIDATIDGIFFVDIQGDRPVRMANCIDRIVFRP